MRLQELFENLLSSIERSFSVRNVFLFGSAIAVITLTILHYFQVLPLSLGYFFFYSIILFLACLARPSWMFLFFVALLPLEIISVMPVNFGFDLRPYQWVGGLLGAAVGIRFITGRLARPFFFQWHVMDTILVVLVSGVAISGAHSQAPTLKQTLVVGSFLFLYFLGRLFLRNWQDVKLALVFFLTSASLSLLWGIGQNVLFLLGYSHFSIMPGRPNGTLIEPDWLGLFSLFLLAPVLFWFKERLMKGFSIKELAVPSLILLFTLIALILTVSRSAWLGAGVLMVSFLVLAFYKKGTGFMARPALLFIQCLIIIAGLALVVVETIPLTRFALIDRVSSTASHDQTLTIACDEVIDYLPGYIERVEDLPNYYDCQHINLEDVHSFENQGKWVTTIKRPDPNVSIRKQIYAVSWQEILTHPVLGIGWGAIGPKLGIDERGASYNASNLFLELWLGGGIIALGSFLFLLGWVIFRTFHVWKQALDTPFLTPLLALLVGFLIFNFFNTGLLLGFVWVWFALFPLVFPKETTVSSSL